MAQTLTDRRDVQFALYEQLDVVSLAKDPKYKGLNKKTFDMVLNEARSLATKEFLPISAEGDVEGCKFENGRVKLPESFHRAYELLKEGEWIALSDDPEAGGQGMPFTIHTAVMEMFHGANTSLALIPMLSHGAGKLIEIFGTEKQKEMFLEKIYSGEWGGTMALTEPEAGSDLAALTTSAVKNPDGTYSLTGNKIFISKAEHDLVENIINPVLAKIEGAPKGTAGISVFIVPNIWVNEDGSLAERNDIVCTGIEEKIGIHASPTCSLALGGKGNCKGLLLGAENAGIKVMFHMMNEERITVACQALGLASTAFLYAVNYARERLQGKHLTEARNPDAPQVAIIEHPDVRRMLMWMKAQLEGMRSLNYYTALCIDKVATESIDEEEKEKLKGFIELLTPVCKAYTTERGCEICNLAIQVHGGNGATKDYPVEQLLRDCKISTIYEGTTGIQAMDLLGRKVAMKKGKVFEAFMEEIRKTIAVAKSMPDIGDIALKLEETLVKLEDTAVKLTQAVRSPKMLSAFGQACPFLDIFGEVIVAWMLLWRASIASPKLAKIIGDGDEAKRKEKLEKNKDAAFFHGQVQTARYFINSVIPATMGKMDAVNNLDDALVEMTDAAFGA